MKLGRDDREALLRGLAGMGATGMAVGYSETGGDDAFNRSFLPIAEHARAFEPDVTLILGERGAGKSALARAMGHAGVISTIRSTLPGVRVPTTDNVQVIQGYPLGPYLPTPSLMREFLEEKQYGLRACQDLWFAYLLCRLSGVISGVDYDEPGLPPLPLIESMRGLDECTGGNPEWYYNEFKEMRESTPIFVLDELNADLARNNRVLYIVYDELDRLSMTDRRGQIVLLRGLLSFWSEYGRRWPRLWPKIFLRSDLFSQELQVPAPDFTRLAANRVELIWNDRALFAMLLKWMANTSDALLEYCRSAGVSFQESPLGLLPVIWKAEQAKPLIDRMIGPYMGGENRKERTFYWLIDHIRTGHGRTVPRVLVRLLALAAQEELRRPKATGQSLLDPASLWRALEQVSLEYVREASSHEWPWLYGVANRLRGGSVPRHDSDLEAWLSDPSDSSPWSDPEGFEPDAGPPATGSELVHHLVDLGIFRELGDGLMDVPDLYLYGFGLRRMGGVRRLYDGP